MLKRNDLIEYSEPSKKTMRLLWLDPAGTVAIAIDVETAVALPEIIQLPMALADMEAGHARLLLDDPYLVLVPDDQLLPSRHREIRDKAWNMINGIVVQEPDVFDANHRGELIARCMDEHGVTHKTLYKYLRRYWQRGQTPNALLPDYAQCGAKGKQRQVNGEVKLGRPVKFGSAPGLNVTPDIRRVFVVGTNRFLLSAKKFTVPAAHGEIIKTFFSRKTIDPETGRIVLHPIEAMEKTGFPSVGQYRYWIAQDFSSLDIKRRRVGAKLYDKDMRGLLGTSTAEVMGPGSRYQIDATIADVYLVSRLDRFRIIGRPVLYVVIDVFSRMIVGLYVGLEGPSWVGAMMALANTTADKAVYCQRFGITIEPEDWPCHFLPGTLLGDRGEIESAKINALINNFNVIVENAASYRADWKGVVEQRFLLLPSRFKPYVPGYIETDYRARGGKDYRLDAVLDLDEFTRIVIECILYYNNHHALTKYDKDRDVLADSVPPIPIELWEWGIRHRSGKLRSFPEELVRFSLLPTDEATVTTFGVRWRGSFYTCQKAIEERWFDRARQTKSWRVTVSYDPRNLDVIYLHHTSDAMKFEVCTLTDRSRAHGSLSLWEVDQQEQADKHASANRRQSQQLAGGNLSANVDKIVEGATQKQGKPSTESASRRTGNIRANRAEEKQANRATETFRFRRSSASPAKSADIVPFPGTASAEPDYSEPDVDEILNSKEQDGD